MNFKVIHFENGEVPFNDEIHFFKWVRLICEENGDSNMIPRSMLEAKLYIKDYCGNFEIINNEPKVIIVTNLDSYSGIHFPDLNKFKHLPKVGDKISTLSKYKTYFRDNLLFNDLEVKSVIFTEMCIQVELNYSNVQLGFLRLR